MKARNKHRNKKVRNKVRNKKIYTGRKLEKKKIRTKPGQKGRQKLSVERNNVQKVEY